MVPAIAVAGELRDRGAEVSFIGTRERAEAELVPQAGYEIDFIDVRGIDRRNPLRAAAALVRAARAVPVARRILRERGAGVVMGGGGYVAGPVGLAAVREGLPLVLTEADSHLGLANRLLARRARRVCLAFPIPGREGEQYLVTGRPVPKTILGADRAAARARFGIATDARCLLVFGGSLGARSLNEAAIEAFAGQPDRSFHVLHVTGRRDYPKLRNRPGPSPDIAFGAGAQDDNWEDYTLLEYEPDLGDVLAACDLVLARAGGSIFEIAAAGRPALLVPYPHATADHQHRNAAWMVEAGAARVITDAELTLEKLRTEVKGLFGDARALAEMAAASKRIARLDAAARIAETVVEAVEIGT